MLHLESVVPDFEAATTMGPMRWHEWLQDSWAILLSFAHLSAVSLTPLSPGWSAFKVCMTALKVTLPIVRGPHSF